MPLRYRIILLLKKFETVIFLTLLTLLFVVGFWSVKTPSSNQVFTDEPMLSKINSSDFLTEKESKSWQEGDLKLRDTNINLYQANLTEGKKSAVGTGESDRSNEIFVQQSPRPNEVVKLDFEANKSEQANFDDSKKLALSSSDLNQFPVTQEKQFGYITITLANAHEYGYAYVVIDGNLWQQGEHNTTPLKIKLPVGNHRVEVKRDGFFCSPEYTAIFIENNAEKRVSFILIPEKSKLPG